MAAADRAKSAEVVELSPRSDGTRYRRVTLVVDDDGGITVRSHEKGAGALDAWGLDDEEVTLTVPPDQAERLALALAAEILKGGQDAVRRLQALCDAHGVSYRLSCWS